MTDVRRPPRLGRLLLSLRPLGHRREDVEADLLELWAERTRTRGRIYAGWRYFLDALSLWFAWDASVQAQPSRLPLRVSGIRRDMVFAVRLYRRSTSVPLVTVTGIALSIAVSTSVFTLVHAMAFRGDGVRGRESIFQVARGVGSAAPTNLAWRYSEFQRLREATPSLELAAALELSGLQVTPETDDEPFGDARVIAVSGSYFRVMGGSSSRGRLLGPADDLPGAPGAIVISHAWWKNRLGSTPDIVGRTFRVEGEIFTVIGVAEREFTGPVAYGTPAAFWVSLSACAELLDRHRDPRSPRWDALVEVFGQLIAGARRERAEMEASSAAIDLARERAPAASGHYVRLQGLGEGRSAGDRNVIATAAIALVLLVVLLACANLANVLLAVTAGRRREIGTRLALGASRGRIVRQLLTESLLLGALGGSLGLVASFWLAPILAALFQFPSSMDVGANRAAYAFAGGVTLLVAVLAGLAPARYGRRGDLLAALQSDRQGAARGMAPGRLRSLLVGGQAAVSLVLLVLAALLTRGLVHASNIDLGFDARTLVNASPGFGRHYDTARAASFWETTLRNVRDIPGVTGVALALLAPFEGAYAPMRVGQTIVFRNETSADYFQTIDSRVLRGRVYTPDEARTGAHVAVITASLAEKFWGAEDPVGATLDRVWGEPDRDDSKPKGLLRKPPGTRVIGVVEDNVTSLRNFDAPTIYLPLAPSGLRNARMIVAASRDQRQLTTAIRDRLLSVDPALRPKTRSVYEGWRRELEGPRAVALLATLIGVSALTLAAVGLFGVTAFVSGQRRQEVSVRMALGATATEVVRLVLRDSLKPVFFGLGAGLLAALALGQLVRGALYGVSARDPVAIFAAVFVLLAAATAAAYIPARRATNVAPAELLKDA